MNSAQSTISEIEDGSTDSSSSDDDNDDDHDDDDDDSNNRTQKPANLNQFPTNPNATTTITTTTTPPVLTQSRKHPQLQFRSSDRQHQQDDIEISLLTNKIISNTQNKQSGKSEHYRSRQPSMVGVEHDVANLLSLSTSISHPNQPDPNGLSPPSSQFTPPFIQHDNVLRSSYVYLEKTNMFGFTKYKRRFCSIKGNQFHCSHHHLMAPTISFNLQNCKIYVEDELRLVELDALPALNSPNSSLYKSLNINPHQQPLNSPQSEQDSATAFFTSLIERHITGPKSAEANLGSHLTRVPDHLCLKNSYHVIFVLVDQEISGYQLRISTDPQLAKKWLRDLIVVATLSRIQTHLYRTTNSPHTIQAANYPKLLPFLAHYRRDASLLKLFPHQSSNPPLNQIDEFDDQTANQQQLSFQEVLPPNVLQMFQQKQHQILALTMKSNPVEQTALDFKQSFEATKSQMYGDETASSSTTSRCLQPTVIQEQPSVPQTPHRRQAGGSAKDYFEALELSKNPKKMAQYQAQLQAQQQAAESRRHQLEQSNLATANTKLNLVEHVIAVSVFVLFLAYLFYRVSK
jgi:hypothetical protein